MKIQKNKQNKKIENEREQKMKFKLKIGKV